MSVFLPALAFAPWLGAQDAAVQSEAFPPAGIAPSIRGALSGKAIRVRLDGVDEGSFWIRRDLPILPKADREISTFPASRVGYPRIAAASLLALVTFEREVLDYRDRVIPKGTYTLRYAVQPGMKEHKGVSKYRDFAVVTPASLDPDLDRGLAETLAASAAAFGRGHPAVLAIFPPPERGATPTIVLNDLGQPMLVVSSGDTTLGIVLRGHGKLDE